jgi:hypothetical protein
MHFSPTIIYKPFFFGGFINTRAKLVQYHKCFQDQFISSIKSLEHLLSETIYETYIKDDFMIVAFLLQRFIIIFQML